MPINWPEMSDDELRECARRGQEPAQVANVESMRRLRNSMDALRHSTDRYAVWLIGLTVVLAVFTAILVYKAFRP
jgi:hypothetical protein